jgi:hypothetical protein
MGIVTTRWGHITQVGIKKFTTRLAVMLRIRDAQLLGTPRNQVADIMQRPREHPVPRGRVMAARTGSMRLNSVLFNNLGLGQVFNPRECGIGLVLAGAQFGCGRGRRGFHGSNLSQNARFGTSGSASVLQCQDSAGL